jgi:hypothetical protein
MSKDSIAMINGHEYKYQYNPETKLMDYKGPVGDAPPLTQEQFQEEMKRFSQREATFFFDPKLFEYSEISEDEFIGLLNQIGNWGEQTVESVMWNMDVHIGKGSSGIVQERLFVGDLSNKRIQHLKRLSKGPLLGPIIINDPNERGPPRAVIWKGYYFEPDDPPGEERRLAQLKPEEEEEAVSGLGKLFAKNSP